MTPTPPSPAEQAIFESVERYIRAKYFNTPVEIVSTCCDGRVATIRRADGEPFPAQYTHGGYADAPTIRVRSEVLEMEVTD